MNGAPERTPTARGECSAGRRGFLAGLASGGALALSGCSELIGERNAELSVDVEGRAWVTSFEGRLADRQLVQPTGLLAAFANDIGFGLGPEPGASSPVLADEHAETPSTVSMTLRPDLEWSNGDPLTAADVGRWAYMLRAGASGLAPVPQIKSGERRPQSPWEAVTDVRWDDRTITLEGRFDAVTSPLYALNAQIGARPRAYYDGLWKEFVAAFDDRPWEDADTRARVASIVEGDLWTLGDDRLPPAGINLEDDYVGTGLEAAYSGLWYPYRTDGSNLHFTVNDSHPFADRVSYDEVVWAFRDDPDARLYDLRSGSIDGAVLDDVSQHAVESVPDAISSFDGPATGGAALQFNHTTHHLGERDVRAAIAAVIDRNSLVEATVDVGDDAVDIPGVDLQHERWAPASLRDVSRPYASDHERARTLLERAGFETNGGDWHTPEGTPFEFTVLTADPDPTLALSIAQQLRSFGIDASMKRVEATSYQQLLRTGQFAATTSSWSSPNAAGLPRARTGEYVRSLVRDGRFPESAFLAAAVDDAVAENGGLRWVSTGPSAADRRLAFDSAEALRAVTVDAPPMGQPDGTPRAWPYLYHAVQSATAADSSDAIEHARACTWVYNYQLPRLELTIDVPTIFHDTSEWSVPPADDPAWRYARRDTQPGGLWSALGWGHVDAD
ncbi:ABC-type transport system, substrate-binding protein [Natronoarchaeum philippinense]|uniref:ABC-type transport system, substrate-binding protein n=1 Tax=Natronoarchaeum philippinense TaxID=558529 RepID=A0A285P5R5_NATPI|nr:ABC transporter substrate-binding protein [Natronoarchaeum philippinense]SNZ17070.1 ABC-type transport system, substrate-binding protein [Natronoarchaeum philippinense]